MQYFVAVTAFYHMHLEEFHMAFHIHPSYEIMYVIDGECEVFLKTLSFKLGVGQGIIIAPNESHMLTVTQGCPCTIANIEFTIRNQQAEGNYDVNDLLDMYPSIVCLLKSPDAYTLFYDNNTYYHSLKDLINELNKGPSMDRYLAHLLLNRMLIILSTRTKMNQRLTGVHYVSAAKKYIQDHYQEELDIETIASYVNVHKSHLHRLFKQYECTSILQYIQSTRMTIAAFLLLNSTKSIIDVAFSTGFNSRQHFSYTFQHFFGVTPSHFRKIKGNIVEKTDTLTFFKYHHVKESNAISE